MIRRDFLIGAAALPIAGFASNPANAAPPIRALVYDTWFRGQWGRLALLADNSIGNMRSLAAEMANTSDCDHGFLLPGRRNGFLIDGAIVVGDWVTLTDDDEVLRGLDRYPCRVVRIIR